MTDLAASLLSLDDAAAQRRWLATHPNALDERLAPALKARADQLMRADIRACLRLVELMFEVARVTANPRDQALALLAEANVRGIYLGEYSRALAGYDAAAAIYAGLGDTLGQAIAQIGRLWPLANLGRTQEALDAGAWAAGVLEAHGQWRRLAELLINQGILQGRLGEDREALAFFDRARHVLTSVADRVVIETSATTDGSPDVAWVEPVLARVDGNRSIVLRNLGEFEAAIEASQSAHQRCVQLGETLEAAKTTQSLALTYLLMGRSNDALALLEEVRGVFEREGLVRHAVLVELFISDCYLLLQRPADVLEHSRRISEVFDALGVNFEVGQALLNAALAYAQLRQPDEALAALVQARRRFQQEDNVVWMAIADLVSAEVYTLQAEYARAMTHAEAAQQVFAQRGLVAREAQAHLATARALLALGRLDDARQRVYAMLTLAGREGGEMPWLTYQAHALLGRLASLAGDRLGAYHAYQQSLQVLERLRGAMMVEFRADFLRDKEEPYQALVGLYLDDGQAEAALATVERAKSRALVDLLSYRLNVRLQAQSVADEPLVAELHRLRAERDQCYRRWQDPEQGREDDREAPGQAGEQARQAMLDLERRITQGLHRLLIRNADYARQVALWQVHVEPAQPALADDTVLVEYYSLEQQLIAFVVTRDAVRAHCLSLAADDVERMLRPFWLNLKTTSSQVVAGQPPTLTRHAQALLQRLYTHLVAPLDADIRAYPNLIVAPHGPLHYLPFHALHDGRAYLIERQAISYLPASSLLRSLQRPTVDDRGALSGLVLGHSHAGRLPYAVQEAEAIGELIKCPILLEDQATLVALHEQAPGRRLIHIAAHGDFRVDQPLFSGVRLADGQLTVLDTFNLRLDASLVTLSACQTGLNVIGGGDELIGLTRGLLYAGAASLLLGHWTVEDRATAVLMQTFYHELVAGQSKTAALRQAQLTFIADAGHPHAPYAHPYFWAPFFLSGDAGPL